MKRFVKATALKAVMVGVVISGMATACQNGDSPVGNLLQDEVKTSTVAQQVKNGATTQSDEARKAEQTRKIAEFLAKPEVKEMSSGLEEIAQAVAVAVEDKALTQRIYEKSMEKFDGATNVLWMHLEADGKLKTQGGWNKRINDVLGQSKRNVQNVDAAIKKFEKVVNAPLHLYWMNAEAWDKKTTPLVAFVPFDVNPKTRTSIPAFDAKGNRVELGKDGALAKQRPVIVININERTDSKGSVRKDLITQNSISSNGSGKGSSAKTQSGYVGIQLVSCNIAASWAWDELPWDGPSEFQIYMATALGWNGSAYLGNVPTGSNQSISAFLGYSIGPGQTNQSGIDWFEDDFASGYDPFDDYMGLHGNIIVNGPGRFYVQFSNPNVTATYYVTY